VLETDEKGRIKLSMKALLERPEGMSRKSASSRASVTVTAPRAVTAKTARAVTARP
jgi:polyribonucleotide nucleotidyltransferase